MSKKQNRGISLIVLVITIIVIIILAGAVILSLTNNNPITQANKATYLSDLRNFQTELDMYETQQFADKSGIYDSTKLQADETSITYDGIINNSITMKDLIPSLGKTTKYAGQFVVVDGKLVYQGSDTNRQTWSTESGIEVVIVGEPTVTIIPPADTVVSSGTDIVYTIKFTSNAPLTTVDLTGKVEVLDDNNITLAIQPTVTIGTVSGTTADVTRQVDVTIVTNTLANGAYKLKIKSGVVTNSNNISNTIDKISPIGFDIDNTAPENPTMSANPSTPTNGNVDITITYSVDTSIKEYSFDSITWDTYTLPVTVTNNGVTVYARGKNNIGNISGVSSITVNNIDIDAPAVAYGTNGATNVQTAETTVTVSDANGLNTSTLQYVWDTQNTTTPTTGWSTFSNGSAIIYGNVTGTYYLWIKASDNAGNMAVSKTNAFSIDGIAPTVAFGTNGGTNPTSVSTTVTLSDVNGLNTSTLQYVWDTQNTTTPSSGWTVFTNGATQTKTGDGIYYLWVKGSDTIGNTVIEKSNVFAIGEVPVSIIQTENKTFSGATSGYSYDNPVIPAGFVAVNTDDSSWYNLSTDYDKGLVIKDASNNQFVWIPVNGTSVIYTKWCTSGISYTTTSDDTTPSGFSTTSITTTYKGFYIARYESMFDYNGGSIRVASKKSTNKTISSWTRDSSHTGYLWNFVSYTDAKTYAENMDTSYGYNTSLMGTNLITGAQWDTALKWIQNSGKSVTDSRTWGNHSDSTSPANVSGYDALQISGFSNYWKANNIYDLAGNTWEWTNEIYSSYRVNRGSHYHRSGSTYPAACRNYNFVTDANYTISFRVGLYVL
ncbi:MAG: SUMF1/EgtB/PvdO family nonheme iron enzyme [Clostridia bacterium]|nr:SUMF1/EgtB/PvdO family nonheme iron enzyme [Clostridia bacterium]MDD4386560.1 SUMF1/EgtB/PvdO family nonheme iron enzyme [Clostridia bacterium]